MRDISRKREIFSMNFRSVKIHREQIVIITKHVRPYEIFVSFFPNAQIRLILFLSIQLLCESISTSSIPGTVEPSGESLNLFRDAITAAYKKEIIKKSGRMTPVFRRVRGSISNARFTRELSSSQHLLLSRRRGELYVPKREKQAERKKGGERERKEQKKVSVPPLFVFPQKEKKERRSFPVCSFQSYFCSFFFFLTDRIL